MEKMIKCTSDLNVFNFGALPNFLHYISLSVNYAYCIYKMLYLMM